jgi:hypothetical protein
MTKKIPYKNNFDKAKRLNSWSNSLLWISSLIIVSAFILKRINSNYIEISNIINIINCIFIIGYTVLGFITEYVLYSANLVKREDFIDNSCNSNFSEEKSSDYFTNDNFDNGISKLGINSFENVLFSYDISKSMLPKLWIISTLLAILFIVLSISGFNNAVILIIQLTLPFKLIFKAIKLSLFVNRMKRIYDDYRRLYSILKDSPNINDKTANILKNVLDYETTLSWANVLLSSKLYNKMNTELSEKWENIKRDYKIK